VFFFFYCFTSRCLLTPGTLHTVIARHANGTRCGRPVFARYFPDYYAGDIFLMLRRAYVCRLILIVAFFNCVTSFQLGRRELRLAAKQKQIMAVLMEAGLAPKFDPGPEPQEHKNAS
jgi:hypothetical protein